MKILGLSILAWVSLNSNVWACLPDPNTFVRVKNNMITEVANRYGFDLLKAKIEIENYKHDMQWQFTDSGYECHDTDIVSATVTMTQSYDNVGNKNCSVTVEIVQRTGPSARMMPIETVSEVSVIQERHCD